MKLEESAIREICQEANAMSNLGYERSIGALRAVKLLLDRTRQPRESFKTIFRNLPVDFRIRAIPPEWYLCPNDSKQYYSLNDSNITDFKGLFESLPKDQRTDEVQWQLIDKYLYEVGRIQMYVHGCQAPRYILPTFRQGGSQWISEFSVSDLIKEHANSFNFHGQNTSQWVYAGCILVQDGQVSTHH